MRPVHAAPGKETGVFPVIIQKCLDEFGADLIGALADRGADGGADIAVAGPEGDHRGHRRLQHARKRAFPARMGRPHHPATGSLNSTGAQSAVSTASTRPGVVVTRASARGRVSGGDASVTTSAEWI